MKVRLLAWKMFIRYSVNARRKEEAMSVQQVEWREMRQTRDGEYCVPYYVVATGNGVQWCFQERSMWDICYVDVPATKRLMVCARAEWRRQCAGGTGSEHTLKPRLS